MLQLTLDFLGKQLERFKPARARRRRVDRTFAWKHGITVHLIFHPRARRYLLGVRPDGSARLVIPRRGNESEGRRFLERSEEWLRQRVAQWQSKSETRQPWLDGSRFLFRGEEVMLSIEDGTLRFADERISVPRALADYRGPVMAHLRGMAERELSVRTRELALLHGISIRRVTVRSQKTRWGSCSAKRTISLNWRLIQAPAYVVDYLIIHELMHCREMNHSARYWKLVAAACPDYGRAEKWLKSRQVELRT
jgi:predicted metal-dependent hydrolase